MITGSLVPKRLPATLAAAFLLVGLLAGPARAHDPVLGVDPAEVHLVLAPGTSEDVAKTVHTPEIPPTPDVFLLIDTTFSMNDDIATVKAKVGELIAGVGAGGLTDPAFGVGIYEDYPFGPWGTAGAGDVAYDLLQPITTDATAVTNAVNALTLGDGNDTPESGYEGLYQALTGAGRDLPNPDGSAPDGDTGDLGEIAPGLGAGFRTDSAKVIILLGDAPFHSPGDGPTSTQFAAGYPGAGEADVAAALGDVNLFCLLPSAIVDGGPASQCTSLGGTNVNVGDASEDIVAAIIAALGDVSVEVVPQASCDDPSVTVSWNPASQTVTSGDDALFTETVSASLAAPQGSTVTCTVDFLVDGELLDGFTQTITVDIPDVTAPAPACTEGTNPHGKTVPRASNQNPDGFYLLTATDNVDSDPSIWVTDAGSGTVFGPYPSGTTIKYTQAPGTTPREQTIGSSNGQAGAVRVHIFGTGDAWVSASDSSGNVSAAVACLVPPPPK
ncbi:MAG TPA: hypothetical protein VF367_07515 [Candidatus Limnocylindria bacterium]